ncbi:MAG: beta-ketoacyl synthase N-terminal-like domain-containing protein, partial [Alphaproteobacteria bacterium]
MTGLRRVVVTGVGMVSPLGAGVDNVWKRLLNAESGIGTIQGFDASHLPSTIGGEVPIVGGVRSDDPFALDPEAVMPDKERRRVDPITIYALAAATEAVEMSGWKPTDEEGQDRTGVMIGSGIGGIQSFTDAVQTVMTKGARRLSPFAIPA